MFHLIHQATFYLHIVVGSLSLIVFWLPFITKKGNRNHKRLGKVFTNVMYTVAASGVVMSSLVLFDPVAVRFPEGELNKEKLESIVFNSRVSAGFLFMLSILVIVFLRQSLLVLKAKHNRELLKTPLHLATLGFVGILGIAVGFVGIVFKIILLDVFAILSIVTCLRCLHYIYKPAIKEREWIIAHLGNICGAGISAYTAFFSFGGRRIFEDILMGNMQILPWVLPGVLGGFAISHMDKKFSKQFKIMDSVNLHSDSMAKTS